MNDEYGAEVTQEVRDAMSTGSHAWLSANNATIGISRLSKWLPTIALVCAAAIIIGVVFSSFVAGRA